MFLVVTSGLEVAAPICSGGRRVRESSRKKPLLIIKNLHSFSVISSAPYFSRFTRIELLATN